MAVDDSLEPRPQWQAAWAGAGRHLAALAACLLLASAAQAARLALVVGNNGYQSVKPLVNAVNDAELMQRTLQRAGFSVDLRRNVGRQALYDAVDALQRRLQPGDEVVFFFAGHGVQVGSDPVLLPVDIQADDEKKVLREGVPLLYVQDALRGARLALMVVDACRDNPFPRHGTRTIGDARGLKAPDVAKGQVVILSAGRGEQALDGVPGQPGVRNGLFTWQFAQVMATPGLDVLSALRRVRDAVEDAAASVNHRQRPSLVDDLRGQFYLAGSASATPPVPTPMPAPEPAPVACAMCPETVLVPGGSFLMGSPANEPDRDNDEGPQRRVTVAPFELGRTEVTQGQWKAVMGSNPSLNSDCGDDCPVENVSWDDVQLFLFRLNVQTDRNYRLPTEAEWEYSARAGTTTPFYTGRTIDSERANFDGSASYNGSVKGLNRQRSIRVASFAANAFGLYDMHGNVWEWVQDPWHDNYRGAPSDASPWTLGGDHERRVFRGGSWFNGPDQLRSAFRARDLSDMRNGATGFRVARSI